MKKLMLSIAAVFVTVLGLGSVAAMSPAYAENAALSGLNNISADNFGGETDLWSIINKVINAILMVVGVIAVFMIILGGINFITSQGDTAKVTKARNTILYGAIGLVIALLAYAIVNFVLNNVMGSN